MQPQPHLPQRPQRLHAEDMATRDRILRGDREAADVFFSQHTDALFEFAFYRSGRDREFAEDVVQDTLLVALDKLGDFDGRSSLHTWLCGIAKNKLRSGRRKLRPRLIEDVLADSDSEIDAILARVETDPLPPEIVAARETRELVGATLSSLPPDYRTALVAKYVDGKTAASMAEEQGKQVKAVESTLYRARQAFSRVFQLLAVRRGDKQ